MKRLYPLSVLFFTLFYCNGKNKIESEKFWQNKIYIYKGEEKILLRGVNIAHTAKRTIIPWVQREDIERLRKFGLNFIRLTLFWSAVEPERGKYDKNYIEKIREILRWVDGLGIYVLIDLHQDIYGFHATHSNEGDGPPEWARDPECPPFKDLDPWMLNYLDESVSCQFESFWNDKNGVQTAYINMFEYVVQQLHNEKGVIGFEIINEPWPGYEWNDTEKWENEKLREFYNKVIKITRKYTQKLIFYETHPLSDFGYPFYLQKPDGNNLVYAPHIYPISAFLGSQSQTDTLSIFNKHLEHSLKYEVPMLVGEYGVAWEDPEAYEKVKEQIDIFDSNFVGSAVWSYDKSSKYDLAIIDDFGNPLSNFVPVIRPYPEFLKGEIKNIKYLQNELTFEYEGDYFVLRCPKILDCFIDSEKVSEEQIKISKKKVSVSWRWKDTKE
ncbi:MAG: glycoside hydrolase family 5 protein [Candidatus Calescibacterium sp.]|nr:glycoside hydrolase family 5 protein [Candidatus Calescibacterium sp.]MCX7733754.1 glycoside hydrolase family 5 protein [bacterium]MDW8086682.1 cellulase family glycosylhydrolase [Candidatus Calescibacterium sp.]